MVVIFFLVTSLFICHFIIIIVLKLQFALVFLAVSKPIYCLNQILKVFLHGSSLPGYCPFQT